MSKLKVDELEESTSGSNITVASGTNLVVTDSLTVGGAAPYTAGGTDVPITDGGTGASSATAAASALGVGTEDSPQFTAVNVGNASDTTLSRASSGVLQVESSELYMAGGTDVAVADGGTGAGTATAGFDALSPMTTVGDIMYGGSSGTVTRLAASTDGHVLTATGAGSAPAWEEAAGVVAGLILPFANASAPTGFLVCDGAAVSRTTYATLFTAIATVWGVGDGSSTFNIPDLRGAFLRGVGTSTGFTQDHTTTLAAFEDDQYQNHSHSIFSSIEGAPGTGSGAVNYAATTPGYFQQYSYTMNMKPSTDPSSGGTPRIGNETRPNNVGITYCIKY